MTNNQKEPKRDSFEKLLQGGSKSVSKRKAKQEKKVKSGFGFYLSHSLLDFSLLWCLF